MYINVYVYIIFYREMPILSPLYLNNYGKDWKSTGLVPSSLRQHWELVEWISGFSIVIEIKWGLNRPFCVWYAQEKVSYIFG